MTDRPERVRSSAFNGILIASVLLAVVGGWACHAALDAELAAQVASVLALISTAFIRLIRMIIAPLVFATLTVGIAHMRASDIGRVGGKALLWFFGASCVSLLLGMLLANGIRPGVGVSLAGATTPSDTPASGPFGLSEFMTHLVPSSIVQAMANNEMLQIVVFSAFFGTAISTLKGKAPHLLALCEELAAVMLRITDFVMRLAPLAIFAALASTIATQGIGILSNYARFIGGFYLALLLLWVILFAALALFVGRRTRDLLACIRESIVLAFATTSSEVAYPCLLEALVAFGAPRRITNLVLPLGYSFNLDGAMVYATFAILFLVQAYGVSLSWSQQLVLFGTTMIATKGVAGVPRAMLLVIGSLLPLFHVPAEGLLLLLAVDHLLDMGRAATNVLGNAVATIAVSSWEHALVDDSSSSIPPSH